MSHAYHIINKDHFNRPVDKLNHFSLRSLNNASASFWKIFGGEKWDAKIEDRRLKNEKGITETKLGRALDTTVQVGTNLALALAGSKAGTGVPGIGSGSNYQNNTPPSTPQEPTFEEKIKANALPIAGGVGVFLFILILIAAFR